MGCHLHDRRVLLYDKQQLWTCWAKVCLHLQIQKHLVARQKYQRQSFVSAAPCGYICSLFCAEGEIKTMQIWDVLRCLCGAACAACIHHNILQLHHFPVVETEEQTKQRHCNFNAPKQACAATYDFHYGLICKCICGLVYKMTNCPLQFSRVPGDVFKSLALPNKTQRYPVCGDAEQRKVAKIHNRPNWTKRKVGALVENKLKLFFLFASTNKPVVIFLQLYLQYCSGYSCQTEEQVYRGFTALCAQP